MGPHIVYPLFPFKRGKTNHPHRLDYERIRRFSASTKLNFFQGFPEVLSKLYPRIRTGAQKALISRLCELLVTRLGQGPAVTSTIILAMVTDTVGFFSFLGIATTLASML
jgi:hypothetical protein